LGLIFTNTENISKQLSQGCDAEGVLVESQKIVEQAIRSNWPAAIGVVMPPRARFVMIDRRRDRAGKRQACQIREKRSRDLNINFVRAIRP
jgi:hypothetical protein